MFILFDLIRNWLWQRRIRPFMVHLAELSTHYDQEIALMQSLLSRGHNADEWQGRFCLLSRQRLAELASFASNHLTQADWRDHRAFFEAECRAVSASLSLLQGRNMLMSRALVPKRSP